MTRPALSLFSGAFCLLVAAGSGTYGQTSAAPDFREVYDLVRAHAAGLSETELNRAAVDGIVHALSPRVVWITNQYDAASAMVPLVSKITSFEDSIAYIRVAHVGEGLSREISAVYKELSATNNLKGLVIDLRYAGGMDYAGAAETADLFLPKAGPLLDWGKGMVSSHEKTNAIRGPVAVLVNRHTAGSAEALTALLRETGAALILGSPTAGQAMVTQDFPLKSGGRLRIATAPLKLGNGKVVPAGGLQPDIDVTVSPEEERAYYADAFLVLPRTNQLALAGSNTNGPAGTNASLRRARMNEAELVREHREGRNREADEATARPAEPSKPVLSDPALARALDLLKGLAVLRQERS